MYVLVSPICISVVGLVDKIPCTVALLASLKIGVHIQGSINVESINKINFVMVLVKSEKELEAEIMKSVKDVTHTFFKIIIATIFLVVVILAFDNTYSIGNLNKRVDVLENRTTLCLVNSSSIDALKNTYARDICCVAVISFIVGFFCAVTSRYEEKKNK